LPIRDYSSRAFASAASAARRVSHGLLFAAGGARRIDDFKRDAASYFASYNLASTEIGAGFNALEERVYLRHVAPGARVCVIGCGSGRDLLPFAARGHDVTGVEPAPGPVDALRRALAAHGRSATVITGFAEDVALPGAFGAIILSPHCYSYVPGSSRRVALLQKLAAHLERDGRMAINFLRRTGSWSRGGVSVASAVARLTGSDCPWEAHDVVQLNEVDGRRSITFEHFFLPEEVAEEAARAGLRVIDHEIDDFLGPITVVAR
jgi:SAM-dependent methyltransferase